MNIIEKIQLRMAAVDSLLCIGLDSEYERLPQEIQSKKNPQFLFNKAIIDVTHQYAVAYKPNMAFYESRGEEGLRDLRLTVEYIKNNYPDVVTICDAKRADIGNTNRGYVVSIFDDMGFDAVTVHPYLGKEALMPFLERSDKATIVLCRTSNPGAGEFQDLIVSKNTPLYIHIAKEVAGSWNSKGNCMLVVGATYPDELQKVRTIVGDMILLVPGLGTQGGSIEQVMRNGCTKSGKGILINSSRDIIFASGDLDFAEKAADKAHMLVTEIRQTRQAIFSAGG